MLGAQAGESGHNQQFVFLPTTCLQHFLLRKNCNCYTALFNSGLLYFFHSWVLSLKALDVRALLVCFLFYFLDAASHLPGIPSALPRHRRTMFPKPKLLVPHADE